jgi:hypothetical protein
MASFDFLEDWFRRKDFYGCPFINAASEYSDRKSGVFHAAMMHKRMTSNPQQANAVSGSYRAYCRAGTGRGSKAALGKLTVPDSFKGTAGKADAVYS